MNNEQRFERRILLSCRLIPASQTGLSAVIHTGVCYTADPKTSLTAFSGPKRPEPTTLLAHVYGTKNIYTALIRLYAAYHMDNPQLYDLAIFTFVGVMFLYTTELVVWKTVRVREYLFPLITAGVGLGWMVTSKGFYVG